METAVPQFPVLVTTSSAAAILGVSRRTVYRLVRAGTLSPVQYREHGELRFRLDEVSALARGGYAATKPKVAA
jgi:excisionase family DNA binding protein